MLVYGTYAWFTYFSDVDSTMTGHVIGWNIDFDGKTNIENEYEIIINDIFPGMENYLNEYKITNSGEASALITSDIKKISIFDDEYIVGEEYDGIVLTNSNILDVLNDKYTFTFGIDISKDVIKTNESSIFQFSLVWPFETYIPLEESEEYNEDEDYYILNGEEYEKTSINETNYNSKKDSLYKLNDEKDTLWGNKAYEFKEENPDTPCVRIEMMINATQYIE